MRKTNYEVFIFKYHYKTWYIRNSCGVKRGVRKIGRAGAGAGEVGRGNEEERELIAKTIFIPYSI